MKKVAIITRTKNRDLLLPRAMESVRRQTFGDYIWVVVNDGGSKDEVNRVVHKAKSMGVEAIIVHNSDSVGMAAASNIGIRASNSKYIVIHDDDDSWNEKFLEKTVSFLESEGGIHYGGVITHIMRVDEEIIGNTVNILGRTPFNQHIRGIYLADIAKANSFSTNSFLYRRDIYNKIGGYDESLPVLDDWVFNMKFLLQADIAVISEPLANYHLRVNTPETAYGNTVVQGINILFLYDVLIRNRLLREDICSGKQGLGYLVNNARVLADRDRQIAEKDRQIEALLNSWSWKITAPLRWIRNLLKFK